jgi:hypothetical protein
VDIIKMDLGEMDWSGMDYIDLPQDRNQWGALVNHSNELSGSIKCWEVLE